MLEGLDAFRFFLNPNGEQEEHTYLYFEIFYGVQKLHKYFSSLLIKYTSLSTCLYIGELRNGRKFEFGNKPFFIFILILRRVFSFSFVRTYSRWDESNVITRN